MKLHDTIAGREIFLGLQQKYGTDDPEELLAIIVMQSLTQIFTSEELDRMTRRSSSKYQVFASQEKADRHFPWIEDAETRLSMEEGLQRKAAALGLQDAPVRERAADGEG